MITPDAIVQRLTIVAILCVVVGMSLGGLIGNGLQPKTTGPISAGEGIGSFVGIMAGIGIAALISRATLPIAPLIGLTLLGAKFGGRLAGEGATSWLGLLVGAAVGLAAGSLVTWLIGKAIAPKPDQLG
jgi:hypothetical protein